MLSTKYFLLCLATGTVLVLVSALLLTGVHRLPVQSFQPAIPHPSENHQLLVVPDRHSTSRKASANLLEKKTSPQTAIQPSSWMISTSPTVSLLAPKRFTSSKLPISRSLSGYRSIVLSESISGVGAVTTPSPDTRRKTRSQSSMVKHPPNALSNSVPNTQNPSYPVAFQDLTQVIMTSAQRSAIIQLQDNFIKEVGDSQSPSDPAYLSRWLNAQQRSYDEMRARLGNTAANQLQLLATQNQAN